MAGLSDVPRPSSRSYNDSHAQLSARSARGLAKTSRGPPVAVRSLSPALQVIQKSLLPDAPRVPDAPRGNRPRDYLSLLQQASPQGLQQTAVGDLKRSISSEAACKESGTTSTVDILRPSSATFRSTRPRTPDHRSDTCREGFRKAPMSARMTRTPSDHIGLAPTAPLSARVDHGRPFSAMPLRTTEDRVRHVGSLWPVDRSRRGGTNDGFDALDALVASACDDVARSDATRTISDSPRTKPGSELKCGIAPVRSQASTPLSSGRYDEAVIDFSPNIGEVDDSRPSVYCSMSATLMSVHLPGSPIPNAVEFDDSDTSVVILTDPIAVTKPQSRGQKVRFECHGPPRKVQSPAPQAPRRKGATSRPLGCTVIAFGGA